MHITAFRPLSLRAFALSMALLTGTHSAWAQGTAAPAGAPASKQEWVKRLVQTQQPSIDAMARSLAEQPAIDMLDRAAQALPSRVAADKQEAVAKAIQADTQKYLDAVVPMVSQRAKQLAPQTIGPILQQKLSEDELRQIVTLLESPAYQKYLQLAGEMQNALQTQLVADTRSKVETQLLTLEKSIGTHLGLTASAAPAQPAAKPAGAAPAAKPPVSK